MEHTSVTKFTLDAPDNYRQAMTDELAEAPTYMFKMGPGTHGPTIITMLNPKSIHSTMGPGHLAVKHVSGGLPAGMRIKEPRALRYETGALLGEGGVGSVYEATDYNLCRTVAVKMLKDGQDSETVEAFLHEGALAAAMDHPNIVPVYDLNVDDNGRVFMSMKKIDGKSLEVLLKEEATPSAEELVTIVIKLCDALAFAHSHGRVHQDIKPANVMLGSFGEVFLIDWGSASESGEHMQISPVYMSPEQAQGLPVSPADDIYCLGATMFHILTERYPTGADTIDKLWERKLAGQIDLPTEKECEKAPLPLLAIALKAMEPRPGDRYDSIKAMGADLCAYQNGFATSAEKAGALRLLQLMIRRQWKTILMAGLIMAGLIGAGIAHAVRVHRAEIAKLASELNVERLERQKAAQKMELERLEREKRDQWLPLVDVDFTKTRSLDPRFRTDGPPEFDDQGLLLGFTSSTGNLAWTEPIGLDQKVEITYTCKSEPYLELALSTNMVGSGYGLQIAESVSLFQTKPWHVVNSGRSKVAEYLRADEPNTIVFWRKGNRFYAEVNGVPALDYTIVSDISGPDHALFSIQRYFALHPLRLHSVRVWRRLEPIYVSVLSQGRTFMRAGNFEKARQQFLHHAMTCPDAGVRQEAQFLAARLAPTQEQKLEEFGPIAADPKHTFNSEALDNAARILAETNDWRGALDMAFKSAGLNSGMNTIEAIMPRLRNNIRQLPQNEKEVLLNRIAGHVPEKGDFSSLQLNDVAFLQGRSVKSLNLSDNPLSDLAPLSGIVITHLNLMNTEVKDISVLKTMPLKSLRADSTAVRDLSPLHGKLLNSLYLAKCSNLDVSTLKGVRARLLVVDSVPIPDPTLLEGVDFAILRARNCGLKDLSFIRKSNPYMLGIDNNQISDLSPLAGLRAVLVSLGYNQVNDLSPLRDCHIQFLSLNGNPVSDLSPLATLNLDSLGLAGTPVTDLSPLAGTGISTLNLDNTRVTDFEVLLSMPDLKDLSISGVELNNKALEQLSKLTLINLTGNIDRNTLAVAAKIKTLKSFSGFKAESVFPIVPALLRALDGQKATKEQIRELRKFAGKGENHDYLLLPLTLTFDEAGNVCSLLGGTLVCPENPKQSQDLADYMISQGHRYNPVWTGLLPLQEGFEFQSGGDVTWFPSRLSEAQNGEMGAGKRCTVNADGIQKGMVEVIEADKLQYVVVEWRRDD